MAAAVPLALSISGDISPVFAIQEFLAATINLSLLETEDVLARAFQELDTVSK